MTLPFEIPPLLWPFVAVVLLVMAWAYTRRHDHIIKQLILLMVQNRAEGFRPLLGSRYRFGWRRAAIALRVMFWMFAASLVAVGATSLLVWAGVLVNPPRSPAVPVNFDASQYEIVTGDHSIYARRRSAPTTQPEH